MRTLLLSLVLLGCGGTSSRAPEMPPPECVTHADTDAGFVPADVFFDGPICVNRALRPSGYVYEFRFPVSAVGTNVRYVIYAEASTFSDLPVNGENLRFGPFAPREQETIYTFDPVSDHTNSNVARWYVFKFVLAYRQDDGVWLKSDESSVEMIRAYDSNTLDLAGWANTPGCEYSL